jgi:hypothetical protein
MTSNYYIVELHIEMNQYYKCCYSFRKLIKINKHNLIQYKTCINVYLSVKKKIGYIAALKSAWFSPGQPTTQVVRPRMDWCSCAPTTLRHGLAQIAQSHEKKYWCYSQCSHRRKHFRNSGPCNWTAYSPSSDSCCWIAQWAEKFYGPFSSNGWRKISLLFHTRMWTSRRPRAR